MRLFFHACPTSVVDAVREIAGRPGDKVQAFPIGFDGEARRIFAVVAPVSETGWP